MVSFGQVRTGYSVAVVASAAFALSGCLSGPTYGTGKGSNVQLLEDLTSIASIGTDKKKQIDYTPRPGIVEPPEGTVLPQPEQSLASKENPQWPESPEETRKRLRGEANAARENGNGSTYRSPLADDPTTSEQYKAFREAKANAKGSYEGRRYLSDPPTEYRIPAETAPVDELGESEYEKEKRRKAAAKKEKNGWSLWPF